MQSWVKNWGMTITYIVDLVEYMCCVVLCSLHSFEFSKRLAKFYTKYKTL